MVQILADLAGFSFRKVAYLSAKGLYERGYIDTRVVNLHFPVNLDPFDKTVVVGDLKLLLLHQIRRFAFWDRVAVWGDTPLVVPPLDTDCCVYVCLPSWAKIYREVGIPIHGWIPRPIDLDVAQEVSNADCSDLVKRFGDYAVTVASDLTTFRYSPPRKGLDMFDRLCGDLRKRGVNCVAVTNWRLSNSHNIPFGSLSERELLRLIKCAKLFVWASRSEGFGIPPVEAMAVGQVVVSSNAPFNELVVGVKFDYREVKEVPIPGTSHSYVCWDYDYRDLLDATDYVLGMSDQEREKISAVAVSAARLLDKSFVAQALARVVY